MFNFHLVRKEGIVEGNLTHLNNKDLVWVDCITPSKQELTQISELTGIATEDLAECLDKAERPRLNEYENYSLMVFRVPFLQNKRIHTTPISIFISKLKNSMLTIRLHELDPVSRIVAKMINQPLPYFEQGLSYMTYKIIDECLNEFFPLLDSIRENIDRIEESLLKSPAKTIMEDIMKAKRSLIYFHKDLSGNRDVISGIEKEYVIHMDKKSTKRFRNIYNDVVQLIDMVSTYRDLLTGSTEVYLSTISNNLNSIMKTLTIISAFVMIPTLISGIYGMNFQVTSHNMPELAWRYGYFFSLVLMLMSILVLFLWFKKKRWL